MVIDGREHGRAEILSKLKSLFAESSSTADMTIDVLVAGREDAIKVGAFAKTSGFRTEIKRASGHFEVRMTGSPCRCG